MVGKLGFKRVTRLLLFAITASSILVFVWNYRHPPQHHLAVIQDSTVDAATDRFPKEIINILHYNTHSGCSLNLKNVLAAVFEAKPNYSVANYDPSALGYGLTHESASLLVESGIYANKICSGVDVVVISDTIPHARGLLLSLLTGNTSNQCISKVIIEFTNRFDYALSQRSDIKKFYRMFRDLARLTELSPNSIVWVANNNFERAYMEYRLGIRLPFIRVLRPLGVIGEDSQYSYPSDLPQPNDSTLIALNHSGSNVFRLLQKTNVPLLVIPNEHTNYGGPNALRQFKGFIEFPYQVSTMKFYENLASGVTMLIPTPQFLERIWLNRDHEVFYFMHVLRDLTPSFANLYRRSAPLYPHVRGFPDWSGYMDYYAAEFAPYILYFDSFQELKDFAVMKNIRTNEITEKQKEFYKQTQKSTIAEWKSIFRTMEYI